MFNSWFVTNGDKPPIPTPLKNNVLLSCSFDNLLTMLQYSILNLTNNGDSALKNAYFVKFSMQRYKKKRKYF